MAKNPFAQEEKASPKTEKFILDATAGFRMMWFDKDNPIVAFYDKDGDEEIAVRGQRINRLSGGVKHKRPWKPRNPTLKGNWERLPFTDSSFHLIVFDPPHIIHAGKKSIFRQQFGCLQAESWQAEFKQAFKEFMRVLAPFGVLVLKWGEHDIKFEKVIKLFPLKPLFGQISAGSGYEFNDERLHSFRKKHRSLTYWFCFMKIPESTENLEHG